MTPAGFDPRLGLQALGYDVADEVAARRAFRRHFLAEESDAPWRAGDLAMLSCLVSKKLATAEVF